MPGIHRHGSGTFPARIKSMPRRKRVDEPGCWHHVMHRGARREAIFFTHQHRMNFMARMVLSMRKYGCDLHAFALMDNHYHLLVQSMEGKLSQAMHLLNAGYARDLSAEKGWDGPVFRSRFHNVVIQNDTQLVHVATYIHLNPVEAGINSHPLLGPYTSYPAYMGTIARPAWLHTHVVLDLAGGHSELRSYTEQHLPPENRDRDWTSPESAIQCLIESPGNSTTAQTYEIDAIMRAVETVTDINPASFMSSNLTRQERRARRLAIASIALWTNMPRAEIARQFGLSPPAVFKAMQITRQRFEIKDIEIELRSHRAKSMPKK